MKVVSLSGSLREGVGKKDAKSCRNAGLIPAVLYGGKEQIHFTVNAMEFNKLLFTPYVYILDLNIDGKKYHSVIQDVQYHPVSDSTIHVDFLEIIADKPIKISIPIKIVGTSPGVIKGGKLVKKLRKLSVVGLEKDLPDTIEVNISKLEITQSIRVENVVVEGLTFLDPARTVVVIIKAARGILDEETEDEDEAEAAPATEE